MATLFKRPGRKNWMIQYFDHSGKRRERSSRTTDRRSAERLAAQLEEVATKVRSGLISSTDASISEAAKSGVDAHVDAYLAWCRQVGQADKNVIEKRRHLERFREETGIERLNQLTGELLLSNMSSMRCTVRDGVDPATGEQRWKSVAPSARSRNFRRQALNAFASWCVKTHRLASNPLTSVEPLDERSDRRRVRRSLTLDEFERLVSVARRQDESLNSDEAYVRRHGPSRRTAWYMAACLAGLRKGDLLRLAWEDIDFEASSITISLGKAKRTDVLPLHPRLAEELLRIEAPSRCGLVFATAVTDLTRRKDFERADIRPDANGRVADLHALRTTLGTMLAREGVAPQIAQKIMRHADYRTTLKHYTSLGLSDTAAALGRLGLNTDASYRRQHHQQKHQQSARETPQNDAFHREQTPRSSVRHLAAVERQNRGYRALDAYCAIIGPDLAGVAQLVERQPSKLNVAGSIPVARFRRPVQPPCRISIGSPISGHPAGLAVAVRSASWLPRPSKTTSRRSIGSKTRRRRARRPWCGLRRRWA